MIEVKVPEVGESIAEVRLGPWNKQAGADVRQDEELVLLETDKVSVALPSPGAGVLTEILKKPGETALVGEVIARIEDKVPAVAQPKTPPPPAPKPKPAPVPAPAPAPPAAPPKPTANGDRVVPMSQLRRTVAKRLVEAQRSAALLTTFNEIDMSAVKAARGETGAAFAERHGVKLGFMSFFVKAVVQALKRVPTLNAELRGDDVVYHERWDIGIAVGGGKGLVVPVLRGADRLGFPEIEKAIADFAKRAEEGRLSPDDLTGGTFTITNGGVYGSLLSTPIVNPPQSGILGMHAVQERPVARDGQVVARPMMYVALTYDHRLVDGREAVTFLKAVKEAVERPLSLLLDA